MLRNGKSIMRILLKAYDYRLLDQCARDIVSTAQRAGASVKGPIPLPMQHKRFSPLRSPHIDKKSKDQFRITTYQRLIEIFSVAYGHDGVPDTQVVDALMKLDMPSGVNIDVKL